jgi:hypothetical protein
LGQDVISALRAVTGDITKGPDSLFTDIGLDAVEKLDEYRDSTCFNDHLGLCG